LASFDSILLLTSILLFVVPSIYAYSGVGEFYYRHIHPLITPYTFVLGTTAQTSSGKYNMTHWLYNHHCSYLYFKKKSLLDAYRDCGTLHRRLSSTSGTIVVHLQTRPNGCRHYWNLFAILQFASFLRSRTLFVRRQRTRWIVDNGKDIVALGYTFSNRQ
jgi:hypothetical protein